MSRREESETGDDEDSVVRYCVNWRNRPGSSYLPTAGTGELTRRLSRRKKKNKTLLARPVHHRRILLVLNDSVSVSSLRVVISF